MIKMADPSPRTAGVSQNRAETFSLQNAWGALARNRWLVLSVLIASFAVAAILTRTAPRVYRSEASIQINDKKSGPLLMEQLTPLAGMDRGRVETDMMVLRSRRLAERVVDSLSLQVRLLAPGATRGTVFRRISGSDPQARGVFALHRQGDGSYTLEREKPTEQAMGKVRPGVPFQVGAITLELDRPRDADDTPETIRFAVTTRARAVDDLRSSMMVARPNRDANVITVSNQSTDLGLVAEVPNVLAAAFSDYVSSGNKAEDRSTVRFLQEQAENYRLQLREAEGGLRTFREQQQVVDLQTEGVEQVRRLAALRAERDALATERAGLAEMIARVRAGTAAGEQSPARQLASFPTFLANKAVQDILQALNAMENERLQLLTRRTNENPDVQAVTQRIAALENQLLQLARGYLTSLDNKIASVDQSMGQFGTRMAAVPAREVEYARRLRDHKLLEEIYTLLQTRLKESEIQLAVDPADVRVLDAATVPERPMSPNPILNLILAGVLGTLAAGSAVFLRETLNTKIRSREDVLHATHGAAVLGTIPRIRPSTSAGRKGVQTAGPLRDERLVMRRDPRSPVAEAYRALRTNLTFASAERTPRLLVVTSAMPGDGKSTSASNLAITMALQGSRVLLVDADMRRGLLHEVVGGSRDPGLSHVLHLGVPLEDAVQHIRVGDAGESLDFLAGGLYPPNPAEMLGSENMRKFLKIVRERYDTVVFDAPPLNLVTDAAVLGTQADVTLLVVRAGITDRKALDHAFSQLQHLGVHVGGTVLNDFSTEEGAYYGYGYGYATVQ
jgi:capsular exopolysaccharide synthesis family protein